MPQTGKKRSVSQQIQLQQARENSPANKTDFEAALASCQDELAEALSEIESLKSELDREREKNAKLTKLLDDSQEKIRNLSSRILLAENHQRVHIKTCAMSAVLVSVLLTAKIF
jgi:peptidoglycan hydrolase CwlO-like protein